MKQIVSQKSPVIPKQNTILNGKDQMYIADAYHYYGKTGKEKDLNEVKKFYEDRKKTHNNNRK